MGKEIIKGKVPFDRNIARLEIFSDGENRDDWRIVLHFQDALYDGEVRVTKPEFGTASVETTYGAIKEMVLPGIGSVSDLFGPIRSFGYLLLEKQELAQQQEQERQRELAAQQQVEK